MSLKAVNENEMLLVSPRHIIAWLFSAPLYMAAAYFIYYLLTSIYYYLSNSASLSEWLRALPGFTFMTLFALGLLALALYMTMTEYVQVDRKRHLILKWRGVLGLKLLPKEVGIGEVTKVICRQKTIKPSHHRRTMNSHRTSRSMTFFIIDLLTSDDETLEVIRFTSKSEAKKWGASLAQFCNIALNDRL